MRPKLKVAHPERCIGCYQCMFACSRKWYNVVSLEKSSIKIKTAGGIESGYIQIVCHACENPPCAKVCPTDALFQQENGTVAIDPEECIQCGKCEEVCLQGAINIDEQIGVIKCRHCGYCTKYCPHDVLELDTAEVL